MGKRKTRFGRNTQTTREMRRLGEREKQREQRKAAIDAFWAMTPEERQKRLETNEAVQRIQRNGITIEDLDRAGKEGYRDGAQQAAESTMINIYAAVALTLKELHGFGKKRILAVLNAIDEKVMYALDSKEMIQQVWEDIGIEMTFNDDPLTERIHEKGA